MLWANNLARSARQPKGVVGEFMGTTPQQLWGVPAQPGTVRTSLAGTRAGAAGILAGSLLI